MSKTYTATDVKLTINGQTISVNAVGAIHDEFPVIIDYPGLLVREKPKPPERKAKWRFEP